MNQERVVVTGMGAMTSVGHTVETMWDSLIDGYAGTRRITNFDVDPYSAKVASLVNDFEPTDYLPAKMSKRMSRFSQLALVAAHEAITDSGIDVTHEDQTQCGVILGCSIGGMDDIESNVLKMNQKGGRYVSAFLVPKITPNMAAFAISSTFGLRGYNYTISTGCASGTHAIGEAAEVIRRRHAQIMITGGTEAAIIETVFASFCNMGALSTYNEPPSQSSRPFNRDRDGFVIGEGAGILVLESLTHAQERGAQIYGEVLGYGTTADAYHYMAPDPTARSVFLAIQNALDHAAVDPEEIDYVNTHGTGTPLGDLAETKAVKLAFGKRAYDIPMNSTKSLIGHSLGASGAIEAIVVLKSMETGWLHPTINLGDPDPQCDLDFVPARARQHAVNIALSNSIGLGGQNASLVLKKMA